MIQIVYYFCIRDSYRGHFLGITKDGSTLAPSSENVKLDLNP